ncbi:hypothetical protein N9B36_03750 [Akkermansiaceae bacterium]|nr:hypothetical protein [Akkermansiaceae bacterium]
MRTYPLAARVWPSAAFHSLHELFHVSGWIVIETAAALETNRKVYVTTILFQKMTAPNSSFVN